MAAIEQRSVHVDGVRTFFRRTAGSGAPVVFVHGNPTSSEDWEPFMERLDRPAVALDLPGWGYSERPSRRHFDYSMDGLARFFGGFLDALEIGEHALVVHDWGSLALIEAQRRPQRVTRLVVINAVPLLDGFRWHWVARHLWRVPILGELANLTSTRAGLRLISRQATPRPGPLPDEFIDRVIATQPPGSWPEMLQLYRRATPERLAAAGADLARLACPALVAWGKQDPYLPFRFGEAYAERLPAARLVAYEGAGHWPWIDRPDLIDNVTGFLGDGEIAVA
jgi:pimeloyl-ACP methyl ester carboxylesterase